MEPQLSARYSDYLAEYLRSGFSVRQIGNTYNTISNGLEQMMTLLILIVGAYTVMTNTDFTIGMLIAFQMYASKASQPMQRVLLGLQPHIQPRRTPCGCCAWWACGSSSSRPICRCKGWAT